MPKHPVKEALEAVKEAAPKMELTRDIANSVDNPVAKVVSVAVFSPVTVPLDLMSWGFSLFD